MTGDAERLLVSLSLKNLVTQLDRNTILLLLPANTDDLAITPFLVETALTTITGARWPALRRTDAGDNHPGCTNRQGERNLLDTGRKSFPTFAVGVATFGLGANLY